MIYMHTNRARAENAQLNTSQLAKKYAPTAIAVFTAVIFLDSLRYKFTNHPYTQEIFGRLDQWAGTLGAEGLFGHTGLFSQYVIGTSELFAAAFLLLGILPRFARLQALGAVAAVAVMSGAISFHLFTPLGTDPNNDGGGLFMAAVAVWFLSLLLLVFRRCELFGLLKDLRITFSSSPKTYSD